MVCRALSSKKRQGQSGPLDVGSRDVQMICQACELRLYSRGPLISMQHVTLKNQPSLSLSQIADLRLAASKLTGPKRRAFGAEMTVQYCDGNPLLAAAIFGWGRQTVALGLAERRTGIMCLGAQSACSGRKRWEEQHPQVAHALCQLADAHAQQDPTFRTSL